MNKKGYSLLEIIVAITIFSIFAASIATAFSTYTNVSTKNNVIATERIKIVSNLEMFISDKNPNQEGLSDISLIKTDGLEDFPEKINCLQKEETSLKTEEKLSAFIKKPNKE